MNFPAFGGLGANDGLRPISAWIAASNTAVTGLCPGTDRQSDRRGGRP